ncbi:MAG: putative Bug-like extra-cytoplasmic solute receptor, TTT-family, partial [Rhodoferax sp.]|nr:putative Bug-like extra-cytoplasmic solute receptor, TTT-family [Rhodoferax sp.]
MKTRRTAISITLSLAAALCAAATAPAFAQAFPSRPVTLVVPFPPGGGTDTGGRVIAEQLSRRWGQPVLVENKGGAAGQIGAE